jgi:hypothetical protein
MGFGPATQGFITLLLATSVLAVCAARTIVVGGSQNLELGLRYPVRAHQNRPLYINDTLGKYQLHIGGQI